MAKHGWIKPNFKQATSKRYDFVGSNQLGKLELSLEVRNEARRFHHKVKVWRQNLTWAGRRCRCTCWWWAGRSPRSWRWTGSRNSGSRCSCCWSSVRRSSWLETRGCGLSNRKLLTFYFGGLSSSVENTPLSAHKEWIFIIGLLYWMIIIDNEFPFFVRQNIRWPPK